ncbi:uncharacterized protein [Montipora capricornis]|uniref:uncharacterized protein n=1 Tax=Montipora capricornis TaxID=246305 RepID=UPI0035F2159B
MAERKRRSEDETVAESGKRARTQIEPKKIHLYRLYGNNYRSQKKIQVVDELMKGKSVAVIARELRIAEATVEVYASDCFAANAPLDKQQYSLVTWKSTPSPSN